MDEWTLDDIGRLAREYADRRDALEEVADEVREAQRRAARQRLRSIRARVGAAAAAKQALRDAVAESPRLFSKPRTQTLHGVKFGLRKRPGRIDGDAAGAISRIEKRMPERAADLIATRKSLRKAALAALGARELAALGLSLVEAGDEVVVQAAAGDLDAFVDALLEDAGEAAE